MSRKKLNFKIPDRLIHSIIKLQMTTKKFYIGISEIHGSGVIATHKILKEESIGEGIIFALIFFPIVTYDLGVWINHSYKPNASLQWINNAWHIVANEKINPDEEITINYSDTPWYIEGPWYYYK